MLTSDFAYKQVIATRNFHFLRLNQANFFYSFETYYSFTIEICEEDPCNFCHRNASCIEAAGQFVCACDAGFRGDGEFCEG